VFFVFLFPALALCLDLVFGALSFSFEPGNDFFVTFHRPVAIVLGFANGLFAPFFFAGLRWRSASSFSRSLSRLALAFSNERMAAFSAAFERCFCNFGFGFGWGCGFLSSGRFASAGKIFGSSAFSLNSPFVPTARFRTVPGLAVAAAMIFVSSVSPAKP
jgi:hypothetical protein